MLAVSMLAGIIGATLFWVKEINANKINIVSCKWYVYKPSIRIWYLLYHIYKQFWIFRVEASLSPFGDIIILQLEREF